MTAAGIAGHTAPRQSVETRPRIGFVGTGWIGRLRMEALLQEDLVDCAAVHDPSSDAATAAAALTEKAAIAPSFESLLDQDLDGVVIATPSAFHAEQCIAALEKGFAVFCQKPLARTRAETEQVLQAARTADRLLQVDFSYRYLAEMQQLRQKIAAGELGDLFAADLVFHNAYGPDKPWFYEVESSGGGCVMDLGIHLVDLLMYLLDTTAVADVASVLYQHGKKLQPPYSCVEDYAQANFQLADVHSRLCCSWNLHAGQDAVIEIKLYGTEGGASITNVQGSFFDFEVKQTRGTSSQHLAGYPDDWGGRALTDWARKLAQSTSFDPSVERAVQVADVIDRIYHR